MIRSFLPRLIATITRHPRQRIARGADFEWSSRSWTHNSFRLYETVFGRRYGKNGVGDTIRAEISVYKDVEGRITYACHSWESALALAEQHVREMLAGLRPRPFRVYIPVLRTPQGLPAFASPYFFAIAFDNSVMHSSSGASTSTVSLTLTGSNMVLFASQKINQTGNTFSAMTYNAVSMTVVDSQTGANSNQKMQDYILPGAATGANNLVGNANASSEFEIMGMSYSGAKQTGQPDAHTQNTSVTTSFTLTLTTTSTTNCWALGTCYADTNPITASTGVHERTNGGGNATESGDSNATITASSTYAMTWTGVSQAFMAAMVSIAPVAAAAAQSEFLPFF